MANCRWTNKEKTRKKLVIGEKMRSPVTFFVQQKENQKKVFKFHGIYKNKYSNYKRISKIVFK